MELIHLTVPDEMQNPLNIFKKDIEIGLSKTNKKISSKYFYDEKGSELFNQITKQPDYYLTDCELEILSTHKSAIASLLKSSSFNLIELGPGEGIKTQLLLQQFTQNQLDFSYIPIDISEEYLATLSKTLELKLPELKVTAIQADFFEGLKWLSVSSIKRNIVLFLGSSIGNLNAQQTRQFLKNLWLTLHDGDYVLIGFDLRKDINLLMNAYDDTAGITREFNFNLLARLNKELGANFNRNNFRHYAFYNPQINAMESYLISNKIQEIQIDALQKKFEFDSFESIHVEYSHKYTLKQIENFTKQIGFEKIQTFTDSRNFFADVLWQVKK